MCNKIFTSELFQRWNSIFLEAPIIFTWFLEPFGGGSVSRTVRLAAPVGTTDYVRSTLLLVGSNQTPAGDAAFYDGFVSETWSDCSWLHELHAEGIFMTCFSFEGRYIGEIIMILMALLLSVPVVLMLVSNCRQFWASDWHSCNMVIDGDRNGTESTTAGLSLKTFTHSSNHWDVPRRHFWHLFFFPLGSVFLED